jgi:hypothetical protein
MRAQILSTVAHDVIEATGNTAHNVIHAYRAGGQTMVGLLEQRWLRALAQSRPQLTAETVGNATAAQQAFSGYCSKGLQLSSLGAHNVVSQLVRLAHNVAGSTLASAKRKKS